MDLAKMRTFEVGVKGDEEGRYTETVCALSAGKAKYEKLLSLRDAWGDEISFKHLTCRTIGHVEPLRLRRTALQRGMPFVHCGMLIEADGMRGRIVNSNDSANWDVLFENGHTGNVHPTYETAYFSADGSVIKDFRTRKPEAAPNA